MAEYDSIQSADEIREAWTRTANQVNELFVSYSETEFLEPRDGRWSHSQNLDHITRSALAVAKGLGMPRMLIRILFGRGQGSRSLPEIRTVYHQALDNGGQARGQFVPRNASSQQDAMAKWNHCSDLLLKNMTRWSETQLDSHRMPHPLIGKLTVREMLLFTIFHTHRHLENTQAD